MAIRIEMLRKINMIWVIIPAYNEGSQIRFVLENLNHVLDSLRIERRIVIVDDGSSDDTAEQAEALSGRIPNEVVRHDVNRGVSAAFRTGFDYVLDLSQSDDLILTLEANKNADPSIIPDMIARIRSSADLVLASCYAPGGRVIGDPLIRYLMSWGINLMLSIVFPIRTSGSIHTYTSFYRLATRRLYSETRERTAGKYFEQEGFVCMADMLIRMSQFPDVRIVEVPLILKSDIREHSSKMKIGRTILGYLRLFWSNLIHRSDTRP